jgi:uncharacterized protein (DUF3084 family)
MVVMRFLVALLVGFIAGVGTTVYFVQSGTGDLVIRRTEVVQELERRLHDVEQQRDQLARQLDDVLARSGRMENAFGEIERRFRDLQQQVEHGAPAAKP